MIPCGRKLTAPSAEVAETSRPADRLLLRLQVRVRVLFFDMLRNIAGRSEESIDVAPAQLRFRSLRGRVSAPQGAAVQHRPGLMELSDAGSELVLNLSQSFARLFHHVPLVFHQRASWARQVGMRDGFITGARRFLSCLASCNDGPWTTARHPGLQHDPAPVKRGWNAARPAGTRA
jgi:hypothetical protein